MKHNVTFLPDGISVSVGTGISVLDAMVAADLHPNAPCGGKGTCGKCLIEINGQTELACQTIVDRDMEVYTTPTEQVKILTGGIKNTSNPDGTDDYAMAFDVGTTTLVACLLDGHTGALLAQECCVNPQVRYGADVISRIQYALKESRTAISDCIRKALTRLTEETAAKAGLTPDQITAFAIAGNTAMHHLLLQIDPKPLVTSPYMPAVFEAIEKNNVRILPNIAGFIGGDTVGCMVSTRFDKREELTLLIDIGTNGEMVLGNKYRRIACSTAAGPAFEGAKISCGMRGAAGAVDHVTHQDGSISYHVIDDVKPIGLCGSGLLDLVAVLLDMGIIDASGRMRPKTYTLCHDVTLTQKDVREVQLAKAAIRAGIELLTEKMGAAVSDIQTVYLAGAFGNYMNPASACRIGMIPPILQERIIPIGNAAGEGAKLCALSRKEFEYSQQLAKETEFLELAGLPQFQRQYIEELGFKPDDMQIINR